MMKNRILKTLILTFTLLLCFCSLTTLVSAEAVNPDRQSSLTLVYKYNTTFYDGLDIKIYRIADVKPDYSFDLAAPFDTYSVNIYGKNSQNEWRTVTTTLASYITADSISPTKALKTDANGKVVFENLRPGIYLTTGLQTRIGNTITKFEDFLTIIPRQNDDYSMTYDVTAYPKCERWSVGDGGPKDPKVTYKVVKQWKDNGQSEKRAKSVKVDIFRNGVRKESVTLSSSNNWKYSWKTDDDGADWTVVERAVPEEYTVEISKIGYSFIITNTYDENPKPPDEDEPTTPPNEDDPTTPPRDDDNPTAPQDDDNNSPTPGNEDNPNPPSDDRPNPPHEDGGRPNPPHEDGDTPNYPSVPKTGDISSVNQYIILMSISGLLITLLSAIFKRKKL